MSLIGHWKLDDNAANTTVVDSSGNGFTGTLNGGDNTSVKHIVDGPGTAITSSFDFNGTDDYVALPTLATMGIGTTGPVSMSCFAKADAAPGVRAGVFTNSDASTRSFGLEFEAANMRFGNFSAGATSSGVTITDWHHYLGVWDGADLNLYVDGVFEATLPRTAAMTATDPLYIGAFFLGFNRFFDGKMNWVKLFDSDESANAAALSDERNSPGGGPTPSPYPYAICI